jgi:hypothetical protein
VSGPVESGPLDDAAGAASSTAGHGHVVGQAPAPSLRSSFFH